MSVAHVLIDGRWRAADAASTFHARNPATGQALADEFPVSRWTDCDAALAAAAGAFDALAQQPERETAEKIAVFLEDYAARIEACSDELVALAHAETALPRTPRLADVELPRTAGQLRQAAAAAREGSWRAATIDTAAGVRSQYASIGPVAVFGPNNFPFAFGSISGGDFAAAIAAGNPVIAKANTSHPATTRRLAVAAQEAANHAGLPPATVQLVYRTSHADGERLVADPRIGATGYTGSRTAGLALKRAADAAGKPVYLELSSVNPVVVLPGAIRERRDEILGEFTTSCLMGTGQFCTNPGLLILLAGDGAESFIAGAVESFSAASAGTLLSAGVLHSLESNVKKLVEAGALALTGAATAEGPGYRYANSLLRTGAAAFLADPATWQSELFGNASLFVVADDLDEAAKLLDCLEGNLTGCIYSDTRGSDDDAYNRLAPRLRRHVGRLLNDKMPTGVAVSPAMHHGGPFPATGHPGFTAVGIPASLVRFAALQCYDAVRPARLPEALQDKNPNGRMWRFIDGTWTRDDVPRER